MIRIANNCDREELTALFIELHSHHVEIKPETFRMPEREWFSRRISEILDDGEFKVFVHDNGFGIDGYAVVKIMDINSEEKFPRKVCYIDCFAVAKNCRRKGIGTELFSAVKKFGIENGCTSVQLGVSACNRGAVAFYEKQGLLQRTIQMELRF